MKKTEEWQTIGWLMEQLKGYPPDTRLEFFTGIYQRPQFPISIYPNEDGTGCNVDLEEGGYEAD